MVVVKVSPYMREDHPLVWLGEKSADQPRLLPIAIGEFEAAAIQMQLEQDEPIRPISYDLLSSMLTRLEVEVRQVVIHTVRRSVYYAKVVVEKDHKIQDIDWPDYLLDSWDENGRCFINNYLQTKPIHYHVKKWLTDDHIERLERLVA